MSRTLIHAGKIHTVVLKKKYYFAPLEKLLWELLHQSLSRAVLEQIVSVISYSIKTAVDRLKGEGGLFGVTVSGALAHSYSAR